MWTVNHVDEAGPSRKHYQSIQPFSGVLGVDTLHIDTVANILDKLRPSYAKSINGNPSYSDHTSIVTHDIGYTPPLL